MNLLEAEQGLTITRSPLEVSEAYIELTIAEARNAIEKPTIVAAELITDPISAAITRANNESFTVASLQPETTDTAVTGADREAVTELIARETGLQPVGASQESTLADEIDEKAPEVEEEPQVEEEPRETAEKRSIGKNILLAARRNKAVMYAAAAVTSATALFSAAHAETAQADNSYKIGVGDAIEVSNGIHYLDDTTEATASDPTVTTESTPGDIELLKANCIQAGLAKPETLNPTGMYNAGVRPDGPVRNPQNLRGAYNFEDITKLCPPELGLVRVSLGVVQMWRDNKWSDITPLGYPASWTNQGRVSTIIGSPPHAFPSFVFNDYIPSKHAFHKVRIELTSTMREEQSRDVVAAEQYILPVEVHGKPNRAIRSKRAAEQQRAERH